MSEAEPIPPTSSVTALRIPIIKKGEYDLWSMKMRHEEADNAPVALALMATSSTDSSNSEGYQLSLESLEVIIRTHEKNEYAWGDKYEQMEYDLKMRDWKLGEKQKEFDNRGESNNSSGDETLTGPLYENFKREKAYKAVPPPTGTIIPPRADVAFTGIDELAIRNKVINKQNSESSGTDHESCESKVRDELNPKTKNKPKILLI
ncbi:hypothetical protein Tco_1125555 [Tanacetum coccineum]|uniref:Uncharacterized protein n=1 Tax=Tanacetum coccineum TaxID=301880 RepID=A0ABQ5JB16_9ASTR